MFGYVAGRPTAPAERLRGEARLAEDNIADTLREVYAFVWLRREDRRKESL